MKATFTFFNEEWNLSDDDTKAQPKDVYGDIYVDGIDEYFPNSPISSTTED
jgi:hypothetical protein